MEILAVLKKRKILGSINIVIIIIIIIIIVIIIIIIIIIMSMFLFIRKNTDQKLQLPGH